MVFLTLAGLLLPGIVEGRTDLTCRECHPTPFFNEKAGPWSPDAIIYQAQGTPCPGLKTVAREVDLTRIRLHRLDLLFTHRTGKDQDDARLGFELEEITWRWRILMEQPLKSAEDFSQKAVALRNRMDTKIFRPLYEKDRARQGRWMALVILTALGFTGFLWLYRRHRINLYRSGSGTIVSGGAK